MRVYIMTAFVEPEHLLECARTAEEAGYHGVTMGDHLAYPKALASGHPAGVQVRPDHPFPDVPVTLAAMGAVTTRLKVVAGVYLLPTRPPLITAKAFATAAILTNYRVVLGIGTGWLEEEFPYTDATFRGRGKRTDEIIELLRKAWSEGWVEHHGDHYEFEPFVLPPVPRQPIPMWGGGEAVAALRRAAHLDGYIGLHYYEMPDALARVRKIQDMRSAEGTIDREDYEILVGLDHQPTVDDCKFLEEAGVTAVWVTPWVPRGLASGDPGLDAMRTSILRYGDEVVQHV